MNRRLSIVIAVAAAGSLGLSLTSCNAPSCGPGTVQEQQKDGTLKCVQDTPAAVTQCDVDAGNVVIVGGKCVSALQCDPATTRDVNGICVGTGGPAGCSTPASGKACVSGTVYDFKTGAKNAVAPLHVDLYDALQLLQGGVPLASQDLATDGGSYVFPDFTPPNFGIIVIMTRSTTGGVAMTAAGTGAQNVSAGNKYVVDLYAIKKADSDAWGGGIDIAAGGAYIAKFYGDMKPDPKLLIANEMMHVAGVTLTKDSSPAGAQYFDATLSAIDTTLTATGSSGVAIVASPIPMGGSFPNFSGTGPTAMPITWETLPGGSAPSVVIITRFHPNM